MFCLLAQGNKGKHDPMIQHEARDCVFLSYLCARVQTA